MSDYSLVKRGVATINHTTGGGVGPLDVDLPAAVKTASSFVVATIRSIRKPIKIQHGQIAATEAATSPQNAAITAVADLALAHVVSSTREKRAGGSGVSVKLSAANQVRAEWLGGALAAGEDIVVEFSVIERLLGHQGATARLLDEDTLRIEWDGTLTEGETIVVSWEVYDLENMGDDLKELLFRAQRILGELGNNQIQDLLVRDDLRNLVGYRVRTFDSKANAKDAEPDIPDGDPLETGELSRRTVTISVDTRRNDRKLLLSVQDSVLEPTPEVD